MSKRNNIKNNDKKVEEVLNKYNKSSILKIILWIAVIVFLIVGFSYKGESMDYNIEIKIKDYGVMEAELYGDIAPITVKNFVELVESKYYDGLKIHRVIDGFMIQGGDGESVKSI